MTHFSIFNDDEVVYLAFLLDKEPEPFIMDGRSFKCWLDLRRETEKEMKFRKLKFARDRS